MVLTRTTKPSLQAAVRRNYAACIPDSDEVKRSMKRLRLLCFDPPAGQVADNLRAGVRCTALFTDEKFAETSLVEFKAEFQSRHYVPLSHSILDSLKIPVCGTGSFQYCKKRSLLSRALQYIGYFSSAEFSSATDFNIYAALASSGHLMPATVLVKDTSPHTSDSLMRFGYDDVQISRNKQTISAHTPDRAGLSFHLLRST